MKVKEILGIISWGQRLSIMKLENEEGREIFSDLNFRTNLDEETKNLRVINIFAEDNWLTIWVKD